MVLYCFVVGFFPARIGSDVQGIVFTMVNGLAGFFIFVTSVFGNKEKGFLTEAAQTACEEAYAVVDDVASLCLNAKEADYRVRNKISQENTIMKRVSLII